jgi:tRNA G10  N-methylase Trm11
LKRDAFIKVSNLFRAMKDYIFIFGRDPELSYIELKTYLNTRNKEFKVKIFNEFGIILGINNIDVSKVIKDLGGTSKIAEVVDLEKIELYHGKKNKIVYGVSAYLGDDCDIREYLKARLKKEKLKAMIKTSKKREPFLTPSESIVVFKDGFEIIVFGKFVGMVKAVYDSSEYKKRDINKPVQRPLHTISIRLAKILINLSGAKEGDVVLDPFCGIGVIMQEALLMKMDAIGIDVEAKCVNDSMKNVNWVKKMYNVDGKFRIIKGDSRYVQNYVKKVDVVATEPYLGPFMKKLPTPEKARDVVRKLTPMYADLLKGLNKVVKGKVAIVMPRFRLYDGKRIKINFLKLIDEAGFKPKKDFPIVYVAVKSKMEREIWVIEKK